MTTTITAAASASAASTSNIASTILANNVASALKGVTVGTMKTMVNGEAPTSLVTDNVRVTMTKAAVGTTGLLVLATPGTEAEIAYGASQSQISIVQSMLLQCGFGGGTADMSTLGYGTIPHPDNKLQSTLIQLTSMSTVATAKTRYNLSHYCTHYK